MEKTNSTNETTTEEQGSEGLLPKAVVTEVEDFDGLTSGDLYETILKHPDWRVVEASDMSADSCRPLAQVFCAGRLVFRYDGASTQNKHEGMCDDLIDLYGAERLPEESYERPVFVLETFAGEDLKDAPLHTAAKSTLDSSAKWIKLHPSK